MKVGLVGAGNISAAYLRRAPLFRGVEIVRVADLDLAAAGARATEFGTRAVTVDELLADPAIELVLNLTTPAAHVAVSRAALQAGKHVYSEKPYVLSLAEGRELADLAEARGLRVGSAPDTFLGGSHQHARALVDSGRLGRIVGGTAHCLGRGMEHWHPNPDFFFRPGAGPMLDMGPYYVAELVQLLGPVRRVVAMSSTPRTTRTIASAPRAGESIEVGTPTSVAAVLEFDSGAQVTLGMSWDVQANRHGHLELYGTDGTLYLPDPNFFGGELELAGADPGASETLGYERPLSAPNEHHDGRGLLANYRCAGLADMIQAIGEGREHRCNGRFALHVVEVLTATLAAGDERASVTLETTCERPQALDATAAARLLNP